MVNRLLGIVVVVGAWAACDFGIDLDRYCAETGRCPDGGVAGGRTSGGSAGGVSGGSTAGGASAGGTSGGASAGGVTAGGSTSGGSTSGGGAGGAASGGAAAGGSSGGGSAGGTAGASAGGSTSGGSSGGASAGGFAFPAGLVFEWRSSRLPPREWFFDLGNPPGCFEVRLSAKLPNDGGPFVFPEPYQFPATSFLADAGTPTPSSTFVTANCGVGQPSFAADASVATLTLNAQRFGVYRIGASIGGTQTVSPNIYARPNAYFIFPRDGGAITRLDGGTCVQYQIVSQGWTAAPVRVEAATATSFSILTSLTPFPWILPGCAATTRLASVTMPEGASSAPFALLFLGDAGAFNLALRPAIFELGAGYGVDVVEEATRFCTPRADAPASACSDSSECCDQNFPVCASSLASLTEPRCLP